MLEHEADAPVARVASVASWPSNSTGRVGPLEAGDDAQQARLARARWPEQRDELAVRHLQADVVTAVNAPKRLLTLRTSMLMRPSPLSTAQRYRPSTPARSPPLDGALRDQRHDGEERQQRRDGEGGLELVLVVEDLHVQRQRVGQAADVAGDDRDRAELPHRPRVAQDDAVEQPPLHVRQRDPPEHLPARGAEHDRGLLLVAPCASITGISSRATKGKVTKTVASTIPGTAKMIFRSCAASHGPSQPCAPEEQHEDDARDHRRDREGQVDQREQERAAREVEARDRPRGGEPEDQVGGHGDRGREQGEPEGRERVGLADRGEVRADAVLERLLEDERERQRPGRARGRRGPP